MAVIINRTGGIAAKSVKMVVYGQSGAGKTTLVRSLPSPIILSAESGLLSIQSADLPYIEINSLQDIYEAYKWLTSSDDSKEYQSVALDSISEVAEVVLSAELKAHKDGRQAYGETNSKMADIIRAFRDLPGRHVYMTAKVEKMQDEMGKILYGPSMPGKTLTQQLPYFFDEVLALRVEKNTEGQVQRFLQAQPDGLWLAKDRSGRLGQWEPADLGEIINKIKEG